MGAFNFFKKFRGQQNDELTRLAADPASNNEFLQALVNSRVFVLGEGSELSTEITEAKLLEHIEQNAQALQSVESADQLQIYTYDLQGHPVLPFFSSNFFVEHFVQSLKIDKIILFDAVQIPFTFLLNEEFLKFNFLLNASAESGRHVSVGDRNKLYDLIEQN